MTKEEFEKLINEFRKRKDKAIELRDDMKRDPENYIGNEITRNYLQGGIDTLLTIIESLEKRYHKLFNI